MAKKWITPGPHFAAQKSQHHRAARLSTSWPITSRTRGAAAWFLLFFLHAFRMVIQQSNMGFFWWDDNDDIQYGAWYIWRFFSAVYRDLQGTSPAWEIPKRWRWRRPLNMDSPQKGQRPAQIMGYIYMGIEDYISMKIWGTGGILFSDKTISSSFPSLWTGDDPPFLSILEDFQWAHDPHFIWGHVSRSF